MTTSERPPSDATEPYRNSKPGEAWNAAYASAPASPAIGVQAVTWGEAREVVQNLLDCPDIADNDYKDEETHAAERRARSFLCAALHPAPSSSPAIGVQVVKALEWRYIPDAFPAPLWTSQTGFGFYNIEEVSASDSPAYEVRLHAHHLVAVNDDLEGAKAATQADYEQRILSALHPGAASPAAAVTWGDSGPIPGQHFGDEFAPSSAPSSGDEDHIAYWKGAYERMAARNSELCEAGRGVLSHMPDYPDSAWTHFEEVLTTGGEASAPSPIGASDGVRAIGDLVDEMAGLAREFDMLGADRLQRAIDTALAALSQETRPRQEGEPVVSKVSIYRSGWNPRGTRKTWERCSITIDSAAEALKGWVSARITDACAWFDDEGRLRVLVAHTDAKRITYRRSTNGGFTIETENRAPSKEGR